MRARDAGQDLTDDRACRFPSVLQALQARNDREYEPEPEPVPSGQSQSQRRLISHSVGVDRRFCFTSEVIAGRQDAESPMLGGSAFFICHGLHKQTLETLTRSRPSRAAALPGGAAVRQAGACDGRTPRLPGRGLPRLALLPLEPDRSQPRRAQQLSRPRDRKAHRARPRVAAKSIPPSKRAAAVLREAPEWGPLSDGGKISGGGSAETAMRAQARKSRIARRGRKRRGRAKTRSI